MPWISGGDNHFRLPPDGLWTQIKGALKHAGVIAGVAAFCGTILILLYGLYQLLR